MPKDRGVKVQFYLSMDEAAALDKVAGQRFKGNRSDAIRKGCQILSFFCEALEEGKELRIVDPATGQEATIVILELRKPSTTGDTPS